MAISILYVLYPSTAVTGETITPTVRIKNSSLTTEFGGVSWGEGSEPDNYAYISAGSWVELNVSSKQMPSTSVSWNVIAWYINPISGMFAPVSGSIVRFTITNNTPVYPVMCPYCSKYFDPSAIEAHKLVCAYRPRPYGTITSSSVPGSAATGDRITPSLVVNNSGAAGYIGVGMGTEYYPTTYTPSSYKSFAAGQSQSMNGTTFTMPANDYDFIIYTFSSFDGNTWQVDERDGFSIDNYAVPHADIVSIIKPASANVGDSMEIGAVLQNSGGEGYIAFSMGSTGTKYSSYVYAGQSISITSYFTQVTGGYSNTLYSWHQDAAGTWVADHSQSRVEVPLTPSAKGVLVSVVNPSTAVVGTTISIGANVRNSGSTGLIGVGTNATSPENLQEVAGNSASTVLISSNYTMPSGGISGRVYVFHSTGSAWVSDASQSFSVSVTTLPMPVGAIVSTNIPTSAIVGSSVGVIVNVKNNGGAGYLGLSIGTGSIVDSEYVAAGGTGTLSTSFTMPTTTFSSMVNIYHMNPNTNVWVTTKDATQSFTVTAVAAPTYTLTILKIGNGTITASPSSATHTAGTVVTLTATPATGWTFSRWSGSITSSSATTTITMNTNVTVTATFVNSTFISGRRAIGTISSEILPVGIPYTAELYLNTNKVATSGAISVASSTTNGESIPAPITLPVAGTYHVFVDVVTGTIKNTFQFDDVFIKSIG